MSGKSGSVRPVGSSVFDRRLRSHSRVVLAPLADHLTRVPAVGITAFGLFAGLAAAGAAAAGWWWVAMVAWLVGRLADGLDGEVARRSGTVSDRGGYVDLVADAVVYAVLPLGIAVGSDVDGVWPATAVLLASFYVNIVSLILFSAIAEARRAERGAPRAGTDAVTTIPLPTGLVEGFETIVFFTLMLAVPGLVVWWMGAMAIAVAVTALGRVLGAWRALDATVESAVPADRAMR